MRGRTMTHQDIARALEDLIREDGKRPPEDQVRDLIAAGVIDEQGECGLATSARTRRTRTWADETRRILTCRPRMRESSPSLSSPSFSVQTCHLASSPI